MRRLSTRRRMDGPNQRTIGYATLGRRLCTALRCVRITRAFRGQCGSAAWSTVQGERNLLRTSVGSGCTKETTWNDLAYVHVSGRIDDINLDVWPIL